MPSETQKHVTEEDLHHLIGKCRSFLYHHEKKITPKSTIEFHRHVALLHEQAKSLINNAHEKGVINKETMKQKGNWVGEFTPLTQHNNLGHYMLSQFNKTPSEHNFEYTNPTKHFSDAVHHIIRQAQRIKHVAKHPNQNTAEKLKTTYGQADIQFAILEHST